MDILSSALVLHVIIGLVGIIASYAVLMGLLKRAPSLAFLKYTSFTAFASYMLSWLIGGYYYVIYYGAAVKPTIKEGAYPWAHTLLMESKEHIFLFLPFLSFIIFLVIALLGREILEKRDLKNSLAALAGVVVAIGTFIALAGIVISGAAGQ
ncbi:MAG: hypothetical protein BMS9Abin13_371 [Patescibacteria group bacterium]|nr:MAG: hypothetical protein BMS9Abin13_371 [Patescibacteria group bacterium]